MEFPANKEESKVLEPVREQHRSNNRVPPLHKVPGRIQVLQQEKGMHAVDTAFVV